MDEATFQPPPKAYEAIIADTQTDRLYEVVLATGGGLASCDGRFEARRSDA